MNFGMTINLPQHRNYPARTLNPNPPKSDRLLGNLNGLIKAQYASNPIPVTPARAEKALLIEDAFVTPQNTMEVTLRNGGQKTITAWSLVFVVGSDSGTSSVTSRAEDKLAGLLRALDVPEEHSSLRPNDTRIVEYPLAVVRHPDASADPFSRGDYSVVDVEIGAVVFDDGTLAGRDVRPVLSFVLDRYARAASLSRLLGRIRSAERAGTLQQLLDSTIKSLEQEQHDLAEAIVHGSAPATPMESLRQQDSALTQQWMMSLLVFTLRNSSRSELDDLGFNATRRHTLEPVDALKVLSARPAKLQKAVQHTTLLFQSELALIQENIPASLRTEIEDTIEQ